MYTRHVDGTTPLDNDQDVLALVASLRAPGAGELQSDELKAVALLSANDRLCRVIRTDSDNEFADLTRGLSGLGFESTGYKAVHCLLFDCVYRRTL